MEVKKRITNEAIAASAGTGKTYTLAVRYIRLLGAGVSPDSIAAMTFTRKAAGEILDRIIVLICEWITDRNRFEKEFVANGYRELNYEKLPSLLHNLLMNIHRLRISTLDSFYVSIIKSFPFEFGLNGDFHIVDASVEKEAKLSVLREVLWHEVDEKRKQAFLADFKQSTYGREEKSILRNMKHFIDDYHDTFLLAGDERIWGNPALIWGEDKDLFTRDVDIKKSCDALRSLLSREELTVKQSEMLNDFINEAEVFLSNHKFHSGNAQKTFKKLLDIKDDISDGSAVITLDRRKILLDQAKCFLLEQIIAYIIKTTIFILKEQTHGLYHILRCYESNYDKLVRRNGLFTFKDVLYQLSLHSVDERFPVLSNLPEKREVDKLYIDYRLDSRFDHWLLDEFQDTSSLQWKVIENLIDEVMQDHSGRRSFFYVGDIKQAIYQWRFGDPRLFNAIFEKFDTAYGNIVKIPLMKSYRSNSEITRTINRVFAGIKCNDDLKAVFPDVVDRLEWENHESAKGEGGYAALIGMDKIKSETKSESIVRKSAIIADRIKAINPLQRNLSTAILVRQHSSGVQYATELKKLGVITSINSRHKLCDNPLVSAFISLITLAEHPQDEYAWRHVNMTPLNNLIEGRDVLAQELLDDIYNHGYRFLIEKWCNALSSKGGVLFDHYYSQKIKDFTAAADIFESGTMSAPHDFIDFIENYDINLSTSGDSVQIMTIHAAKGLGFDIVFLPDLKWNKGITNAQLEGLEVKKGVSGFPEWAFLMPGIDIAKKLPVFSEYIEEKCKDTCYENLCLLYVAMTRAAKALYMIVDKSATKTVYASTIVEKTLTALTDEIGDPGKFEEASAGHQLSSGVGAETPEEERRGCPVLTSSWEKQMMHYGASQLYLNGKEKWFEAYPLKKERETVFSSVSLNISFKNTLHSKTPSGSEPYLTYGANLFSGATSKALTLGIAVHELFEHLAWADIDDCEDVFRKWYAEADYEESILENAGEIFLTSLNSSEIFNALSRPSPYSVLWREKDFSIILGNEWINGSFDRVVINKNSDGKIDNAVICDYKTDKIESDIDLKRKAEIYRHQLNLYSKALSSIIKIDESKISKQLIFLKAGRVVTNLITVNNQKSIGK